jgi:hypothetical protein
MTAVSDVQPVDRCTCCAAPSNVLHIPLMAGVARQHAHSCGVRHGGAQCCKDRGAMLRRREAAARQQLPQQSGCLRKLPGAADVRRKLRQRHGHGVRLWVPCRQTMCYGCCHRCVQYGRRTVKPLYRTPTATHFMSTCTWRWRRRYKILWRSCLRDFPVCIASSGNFNAHVHAHAHQSRTHTRLVCFPLRSTRLTL